MATNSQISYHFRRATPTADGSEVNYNLDRYGNLGTFDWRYDLVKAGYVWRFKSGAGPATGGDATGSTGGGNGTTIDGDQPDFIISNSSSDYLMIPLELRIDSIAIDIDADGEYAAAMWAVDATQSYTTATATAMTGINVLGVGAAGTFSPQSVPTNIYAATVVTADITDPVISDVLAASRVQAADAGTAASQQGYELHAVWVPAYPYFIRNGTLLGYWGGTAAMTAIASATVAIVPVSHFRQ